MRESPRYPCQEEARECLLPRIWRLFGSWQWHLALLCGLALTLVSLPLRLAFDVGGGALEAFEDLIDALFFSQGCLLEFNTHQVSQILIIIVFF